MAKEVEERLVYTGGYIPPTDLAHDDIDKVVKMVKKMAGRRDSIESEDEVHPSCKLYGIDIIKDKGGKK